jgi:ketosteroid isomerase-like protein
MTDNVRRAREGFEAFNRGDMEAVLDFLHPDVEVRSVAEVGQEGDYRGRDGFLHWNGLWMEAWEEFQVELKELEEVDDHNVLVHCDQWGRGRGSGLEVHQTVTYLFTIDEAGKATRVHIYTEREDALAAARA